MDEVTDSLAVKEENHSENENTDEIKNEELPSEVDEQKTPCSHIEIKHESDDGEEQTFEMASVIITEDNPIKFENEEGDVEDVPPKTTKAKRRPGPRSRKRKQSELSESDGTMSPPSVGIRRSSRRTATSSHLPGRHISQTYRDTEVFEPDNLLHCDDCASFYVGDCPEHGPLNIVEDVEVPIDLSDQSRASRTAPPLVRIGDSNIPGVGCGVRAVETIPPRTRFGPYEGVIIPIDEGTSYSWLVRKDGQPAHCLDGTEPGLSNWMRFINCSRNDSQRNLVAFQYLGKLYYRTTCQIEPDEELLVWCGREYGRQLGIPVDSSNAATVKSVKDSPKETFHGSDEMDEIRMVADSPKETFHGSDEMDEIRKVADSPKETYHGSGETDEIPMVVDSPKETSHNSDEMDETVTSSVFVSKTYIEVDFIDESDLMSISTADESPFVCNQCNEYCFDEETLTSHLLTHAGENPFVCSVCNERFFDRKTLTNHQKGHGAQETSAYVCTECFQTFETRDQFLKHERKHNREKPFLCLKCNKRFAQSDELKGHLQFHDGEKPFGCDQCNKRFHMKHQLQKHLWAHIEEKPPFICPGCQKEFSQKFNLEQHLAAHGDCARRAMTCSVCGLHCRDQSDLQSHMESEHSGAKPFECLSCFDRFFDRAALSRHERMHAEEKPFHCRYCHRRFIRKMDLRNHIVRVHRHKEPCKTCGGRFPTKEDFDAHLAACESKETFPCTVCGQSFADKSDLTTHMADHSEKQFVCPDCNQEYSSRKALVRHIRTHNVDRPHSCSECEKGFKTSGALKVHMQMHSGEKLHACTICNKKFKFKISFTRHLRKHGFENTAVANPSATESQENVDDDVILITS